MTRRNSFWTFALMLIAMGVSAPVGAQEISFSSDSAQSVGEVPSVFGPQETETIGLTARLRAPDTITPDEAAAVDTDAIEHHHDYVWGLCCGEVHLDKNKTFKVGIGIRTSFNSIEDGSPNGDRWSNDVDLDNLRLYFSGEAWDYLAFELNTDINNAQGFEDTVQTLGGGLLGDTNVFEEAGEVRILDAVIKFNFSDCFNVWIGRFLPPSDRSNLDGPFYLNVWEFPFVQFGYPNIFQGRDDGVAVWGQKGGGMFKWQTGIFKGTEGFPNGDDHVMWTGRVVLNLLDPEPGYYNQSTYYGEKEIFAIGLAGMSQRDAVGTIADPRDFTGWNIDALYETKLAGGGVVSLEGAYYDFDDDDATSIETATGISTLTRQGESYFLLASYLCPCKVGYGKVWGNFQPYVRWQEYDRDFTTTGVLEDQVDLGLNYIIDGHDARVSLVWERRSAAGMSDFDLLRVGAQVQF